MKQLAALPVPCLVALLCAVRAAQASDAGVDPDWFPLRAGTEWVYEAHRDQSYRPDNASISRVFHAGRDVRTVSDAPDRTPGRFLVRDTMQLVPTSGMGEKETLPGWTLVSFGGELRIHGMGETRADGTDDQVAYDPPLRLLPTTKAGESWDAGTFRTGGLSARLRGEVIGSEDLPGWSGCLAVKLAGSITGKASGLKDPAEIESGGFERLLWFARGVGIVREVTTMKLDLKRADDHHTHTIQVLTLRLLEQRGAR